MATIDLTHEDEKEDRKMPPPEVLDVDAEPEVVDVDADPEVEVVSLPAAVVAFSSSTADADLALALSLADGGSSQFLPRHKRKRGALFSCGICLEDDLESGKGYSVDACKHRFCTDCLTQWVQSSVDSASASSSLKIDCPQDKCQCTLSFNDIQYILRYDPVSWKTYSETASACTLEAEVMDEGSDTRRCPSERCNYIFAFHQGTGAEGTHFDCPSCHTSYCLNCGANQGKVGPGHKTMTCHDRKIQLEKQEEERRKFDAWKVENAKADERFNELLEKERKSGLTKPCPKCKTPITKNGGCPHMHCTSCNTHFTWGGKTAKPRIMPGYR